MRQHPTRPGRLIATLAPLAVVMVTLGLSASSAHAQGAPTSDEPQDTLDYRIGPAADADTSDGGGWFALDAEPGTEATQQVVVENLGDTPLELALAAVDADTSSVGGAVYGKVTDPVEATGQWISVQRERVQLDPGEHDTVDISVTVPEDARSGTHLAGIAASVPEDVEENEAGEGAVVAITQRRVLAMQITLPGPAEPNLRITNVEPQSHAGGVRLLVHLANEGNGLTSGSGVIEVDEPAFEHPFEFGTVVPDTSFAYPVPWLEGRPDEGSYQARVEVEYGEWTETWEGTVTLGESTMHELDRREVEAGTPWGWVAAVAAIVVLALVAAGTWLLLRVTGTPRRRPRQPATSPSGWAPVPPAPHHVTASRPLEDLPGPPNSPAHRDDLVPPPPPASITTR